MYYISMVGVHLALPSDEVSEESRLWLCDYFVRK